MKKLLALVLAVLMVLSMAACQTQPAETTPPATQGGNDTPTQPKETEPEAKDPVTITYWYGGQGQMEDTDKVEAKLNEILKTIPGYEYITIDLRPTKSFAKNFVLAQSDKEQIDLVASFYLNVTDLWADNAILPLDDLLEQYPDVISEIPDWMVDQGKVWGEQAFIPTAQQAATMYYLQFNQDMMDAYLESERITLEQFKSVIKSGNFKVILDTLEEYLEFQRAYCGTDKIYAQFPFDMNFWLNLEFIGNAYGQMVLVEGEDEVQWITMSDEYKYLLSRAADWYERGLIFNDTTYKFDRSRWGKEDSQAWGYNQNCASEEMIQEIYASENVYSIAMRDHYYITSVYAAGGTFIYADTQHPEECMMIMELLHTKKHGTEFYNTLCWGLEGKHWEWEDKEAGRIKTLEFDTPQGNSQCSYQAWKWQIGNSFNAWENQAARPGQNDYIIGVHESDETVKSPAMGITWDLSEIADIVSQCNAVHTEYSAASIYSLGKNWEDRYNDMVTKLKVAGIDLATKIVNDQYADFLAGKAK